MKLDPVSFFANRFLFYFQWEYINNPKNENDILARKLCHTFRFKLRLCYWRSSFSINNGCPYGIRPCNISC